MTNNRRRNGADLSPKTEGRPSVLGFRVSAKPPHPIPLPEGEGKFSWLYTHRLLRVFSASLSLKPSRS